MSLELVDPSKTFELKHSSGAVFVLKHWTASMQEEVEKRCIVNLGNGKFEYLTSLDRELKIELSVESWAGITSNSESVPCTKDNKKLLPIGVQLWLAKEIEERAGLRITEEEKKN